jgi:hypothetical protein
MNVVGNALVVHFEQQIQHHQTDRKETNDDE